MKKLMVILCAMLLVFGVVGISTAKLWDRGGGLIYDDDLNITWLQDANYAKTSGYDNDGAMPYLQATSWVENLEYYDSVRCVTWKDWRLPFAGNPPQWFRAEQSSEMGHLYYVELGNLEGYFTSPKSSECVKVAVPISLKQPELERSV